MLFTALFALGVRTFSVAEMQPVYEIKRQIEHARALQEQGNNADARKIYQQVLPMLRGAQSSVSLAYVLDQMSRIESAQGNYPAAEAWAQQAADVYRRIGNAEGEAQAYNNKGIAEVQRGAYAAAQGDLQKALDLARAAKSSEVETKALNNLGSAFYFEGKYQEALYRYEQAMRVVERSAAAHWSEYWRHITMFNQATLYQRLGRYDKALPIYREVEYSKALTQGDRAHLLANLGALYRRLGDPWKALETYRFAEKLYATAHDADGEISVLKNTGIVYGLDLEDLAHARSIFERARQLAHSTHNAREEMQARLYLGETLLRERAIAAARREFDHARSMADKLGTPEEQWKALYGLGRVEELSDHNEAAEAAYKEAIAIIEKGRSTLQFSALRSDFLADKRDVYDALLGLLFQKQDVGGVFSYLERSRARIFQDDLAGHETAATPFFPTLEEIRIRLPANALLLELWLSGDRLGAFWCRNDGCGVGWKKLEASISNATQRLLEELPRGLGADWRERVAMLGSLLPLDASLWTSRRHLLIVPDGWLSFLPFDLLPVSPGAKELLIEQHDITYLPSAVVLLRRRVAEYFPRPPWTPELAAFGDPIFSAKAGLGDMEPASLRRLTASSTEVRTIAQMVHGKSHLFLGKDNVKRQFLRMANQSALVHVSTHSFADSDDPENSRLMFSPEGPERAADYVFLRELYALDLRHVELVTLAACDTERGKLIRGEGVQAFSRALLARGARASFTTLWRVDDDATAEFMKHFYFFSLQQRKPKAEALRLAKLKFLNSGSRLDNPQFWAAFVLHGDGLGPMPRVVSWSQLALWAVIAVAIAAIWLMLQRRCRIDRKHDARVLVAHHAKHLNGNA